MQLVKDGANVQAAPDDKALRRDLVTQAKFVNENVSRMEIVRVEFNKLKKFEQG